MRDERRGQVHRREDEPDLHVREAAGVQERLVEVDGRAQEHEHHRRVADDPGQAAAQADVAEILPDRRLGGASEARIRDTTDEELVAPRAEMGRGDARE